MVAPRTPTLVTGSLEAAHAHLEKLALRTETGPSDDPFSVQVSFDDDLARVLPRSTVRASVTRLFGVDPGFDMGADVFSAMIGLALSSGAPVYPSDLLGCFAEKAATCEHQGRYSYFVDTPDFAADTDCTALAAGGLYEHGRLPRADLGASARELLRAAAPAGSCPDHRDAPPRPGTEPDVVMVYWDDGPRGRGRRQDPVVSANALYTLALAADAGAVEGGAGVVEATARYVGVHLTSSALLSGTRYYPDPNAFLVAVSRLCDRFDVYARAWGRDLERQSTAMLTRPPRDPLSLAQSVLAARTAGAPAGRLREHQRLLVGSQQDDGSWPAAPYYRMGRFAVHFGSPLITTLFAVAALGDGAQPLPGAAS